MDFQFAPVSKARGYQARLMLSALVSAIIFAADAVAARKCHTAPPRLSVALVIVPVSLTCIANPLLSMPRTALPCGLHSAARPPPVTVMLLHGIGSNRQDMVSLGYLFLRHGYSVHGTGSPRARRKRAVSGLRISKKAISTGWTGCHETAGRRGFMDSGRHSARPFAEIAGARDSLPGGCVAESSYFDFPSVADERIARMLPDNDGQAPLVDSGLAWTRWRDGIDLRKASPADGVRFTPVPVLLIHGLADGKTSPDNSRRLAALNPSVNLWLGNTGFSHTDA